MTDDGETTWLRKTVEAGLHRNGLTRVERILIYVLIGLCATLDRVPEILPVAEAMFG